MKSPRIIFCVAAACLFTVFSQPVQAAVETHQLGFKVGSSRVDTTYYNNAGVCARIHEVLSVRPGTRISINSYSSPDGKTSRNRQLARQRAESAKETLLAQNPSLDPSQIVINLAEEDWKGVKTYLERCNKDWKDEALEILKKTDVDRKALLQDLWVGEAWEDLMKNCFPALRRVTLQLTDDPAAQNGSSSASEGVSTATLHFGNGASVIQQNFMDNAAGLENLRKIAQSAAQELYIYVKSSPEGNESANERLGNRRGKAIEKRLRQLGFSGKVNIIYVGEDWDGLAQAVEASADLPDKEAILNILSDQTKTRNSRKKALQALEYGKTWLHLLDVEMSGLRSAVVSDCAL